MESLVLWKRNVSIAATQYVAAPIKSSVLISAVIILTTGSTVIQIILSEMFTDY
jgi:hypothetical protein